MKELLGNIRFYILVASVIFSLAVNVYITLTIPAGQLQTIRLNQIYGFAAIILLYFALLAGPFCYMFSNFQWKKQYLKARRALGVSAFYFAALHGIIAFFGQLNGFEGLSFLTPSYLIALSISSVALFIFMLQALTSFDAVIEKMTFPRWKILQRFVYLGGILTLLHIVMLGSHFQDFSSPFVRITFLALAFLFFLEALRIDAWLQRLFHLEQKFGYGTVILSGIFITIAIFLFAPLPNKGSFSFGIHPQHSTMQQAEMPSAMMASMQGDRSLRYTVSFDKPDIIQPNQDTQLKFSVYNATNGNQVNLFQNIYTKEAHLIIVDNQLQYFEHIHPQKDGNSFTINTRFPHPGVYRAYLTYQPVGAVEQEVGFSFQVGVNDAQNTSSDEQIIDTNTTKTVGGYEISLSTDKELNVKDMTEGNQRLAFVLKDARTKNPIKTLKPYLGAFGHLVMINQTDYSYLHVHPLGVPYGPNANGGPEVTFVPMPVLDPIRPGVYRVFAEFNPNGEHIVADFTVRVN